MRWQHRLAAWIREWFRSSAIDRELDEELQFHFDRQVEANIQAGMSAADARRAARLAIGNVEPVREASRDARAGALLRQFGRDCVFGVRLLTKAPGFTVAAITIIALGIGSVTAIFSVVYGVVLKPLPFRDPDRLVNLWTIGGTDTSRHFLVNAADQRDWAAQNTVFEGVAALRNIANFNLIGDGADPERLLAARIDANVLPVLGVSPALGRNFTTDEDEVGNDRKALLSDGLWRRRFGADPAILGRTINLSGVPHTVVGVMGPDFHYPGREFQLWTPLTINPRELERTEVTSSLMVIARLKRGVSVERAQSELSTIAARLAAAYKQNEGRGVHVVPLHADMLANVRMSLYVLLGAVTCLLLVAALNLTTLLSARAAARQRELSVRLALGATRGRVALQTVAEIVPILIAGGIIGIAIAAGSVTWFIPLAPAAMPRLESVSINGPVLAASIAILTMTGVIAALLPASQAWRSDHTTAGREDGRAIAGSAGQVRARQILVVTQIALALPLLTGGVLLTRTFQALTAIDPGFDARNVLTMHLALSRSKYRTDAAIARLTSDIAERVSTLAGTSSAGLVSRLPLAGGLAVMTYEFDAPQWDERVPTVDVRSATPDYFKTMGIPLVEGRVFDGRDHEAAPVVAIIDDRIARTLWPGRSAVGKRVRIPAVLANNTPQPWMEIVGVVGHVIHDSIELDTRPQLYFHHLQRAQDRMVLVAKAAGDPALLAPAVREAIRAIDPEQPVYDVRTLTEVVDRSLAQQRLAMTLLVAFAGAALLLCAVGVYGVIAFGVTRQRREFGIRLALGATRSEITRAVVRRGVVLAVIGIAIGSALAFAFTRGMASMLFGVGATDVFSFAGSMLLLLAIAFLASALPARRAAAVDPAVILRSD